MRFTQFLTALSFASIFLAGQHVAYGKAQDGMTISRRGTDSPNTPGGGSNANPISGGGNNDPIGKH